VFASFQPADLSDGVRLPEVLGPFNGIPWASPVWGGLSNSTPVPLSGFLSLSAVS